MGAQVLYASLPIAAKIALAYMPGVGIIASRAVLALVVFAAIYLSGKRERLPLRHLPQVAGYALTGIVCNQLLFVYGLARTTATNAVVIGASVPVFTTGLAILVGRERGTWQKIAGLAIALA